MKAFSPLKVGSAVLRDVLKVRQWTCPCVYLAQLLTLVLDSGLPDLPKDEML